MATVANGQSLVVIVHPLSSSNHLLLPFINPNPESPLNYANLLKSETMGNALHTPTLNIPVKHVTMLHGEPYIKWIKTEVEGIDIIEALQHVVAENFRMDGWNLRN